MENFDINRFSKTFFNSKFYIMFILALSLTLGYFYSYYYVTPMYQSFATVVLVQNENLEQDVPTYSSITQTDINLNKNLLSTYTKIAKSDTVLEQVIKDLNLNMTPNELKNFVTVQAVNNTQVFKIGVASEDNKMAALITNHLLEVFSKEVKSLYNMNNIYTMDPAEVVNIPYNIHHMKDMVIFIMIGFIFSCVLVLIIYTFDTTIKCEEDIENYTNLCVLSSIPIYKAKFGKHKTELIVNEEPKSPISECFKTFRTNVMFSITNKQFNNILVTSGFMGEGKSFVSSNLAIAFANSGKKVILIDTDMRKGRVHKIFDLPNEQGLSTCLSKIGTLGSSLNINEFIKESSISNLHVMTCGIVPPNPSELLSSSNMVKLLEALNRQYDVVICDGTPCMLVSDSIVLSKIVDTTVIVTANKVTKLDTLLNIKKSIEMVGGNICGAIINMMDVNKKDYKNNYYYGEKSKHKYISSSSFVHDIVLDSPLFVNDTPIAKENKVMKPNVSIDSDFVNSPTEDFATISNTLFENTKQLSELRNLYKDLIHYTLKFTKESNNNLFLEKFKDLKFDYTNMINSQGNEITVLYKKLEDMKSSDLTDSILNKLESLQSDYYSLIHAQSEELKALYGKLEDINLRFELLEAHANNNKTLINNLSKQIELSEANNLVMDELENKVIKIADYLEQSAKNQDINEHSHISDFAKKIKPILDDELQDDMVETVVEDNTQDNIVDAIVEDNVQDDITDAIVEDNAQDDIAETIVEDNAQGNIAETVVTQESSSVVNYETIKNKKKHRFSLFKSKEKDIIEDEPITIVSQILLKSNEFAG